MVLKEAPGIVPAIDMPLGKALPYIAKLQGLSKLITGLKLGSDIIDVHGFNTTALVLEELENELPIILDLQKRGNDVPFMVKRQVNTAAEYGIGTYIGHPIGSGSNDGPEEKDWGTLQAFVRYSQQSNIDPIVVLELTPPGSSYFLGDEASEELARVSKELGVKYFVAPATRPERIGVYREILGDECEIISPGTGPQKTGDVVADAVNAIKAGADHLVIGRGIYQAKDPFETVERVYAAIEEAYCKR